MKRNMTAAVMALAMSTVMSVAVFLYKKSDLIYLHL